jgi:hypothetical protein
MIRLLGLGVFLTVVFKLSLPGRIISTLNRWLDAAYLSTLVDRLTEIEKEQELDFNRARARWEQEKYKGETAYLVYTITEEEVPAVELRGGTVFRPLQNWNIPGNYVFTALERSLLQQWMLEVTQSVSQGKVGDSEIPGPWLLHIGRARYEDPESCLAPRVLPQ